MVALVLIFPRNVSCQNAQSSCLHDGEKGDDIIVELVHSSWDYNPSYHLGAPPGFRSPFPLTTDTVKTVGLGQKHCRYYERRSEEDPSAAVSVTLLGLRNRPQKGVVVFSRKDVGFHQFWTMILGDLKLISSEKHGIFQCEFILSYDWMLWVLLICWRVVQRGM